MELKSILVFFLIFSDVNTFRDLEKAVRIQVLNATLFIKIRLKIDNIRYVQKSNQYFSSDKSVYLFGGSDGL
jgi:hypothetical protein